MAPQIKDSKPNCILSAILGFALDLCRQWEIASEALQPQEPQTPSPTVETIQSKPQSKLSLSHLPDEIEKAATEAACDILA